MSNENRAVVTRWFEEVWNQRRAETMHELMSDDSVCHDDQGLVRGIDEFKQRQYDPMLSAFPDLRVQIDGMLDRDDEVVVRWTAKGTHTGEGLEIEPTRKQVSFSGISWICVRDGKLHEGWQCSNIADVIRRLPEPVA